MWQCIIISKVVHNIRIYLFILSLICSLSTILSKEYVIEEETRIEGKLNTKSTKFLPR